MQIQTVQLSTCRKNWSNIVKKAWYNPRRNFCSDLKRGIGCEKRLEISLYTTHRNHNSRRFPQRDSQVPYFSGSTQETTNACNFLQASVMTPTGLHPDALYPVNYGVWCVSRYGRTHKSTHIPPRGYEV